MMESFKSQNKHTVFHFFSFCCIQILLATLCCTIPLSRKDTHAQTTSLYGKRRETNQPSTISSSFVAFPSNFAIHLSTEKYCFAHTNVSLQLFYPILLKYLSTLQNICRYTNTKQICVTLRQFCCFRCFVHARDACVCVCVCAYLCCSCFPSELIVR